MKKLMKLVVLIPFILLINIEYVQAIDLSPTTVGIKTVYYSDVKRGRPIVADVYYPIDAKQVGEATSSIMMQAKQAREVPIINSKDPGGYPLIVLSHGYGGSRQHLSWFAEDLSAKGYIVAAIEHFGNTASFDTPQISLKRWLRPQDVSEFLNQFLQDSNWNKVINPNRIGFAGFSLGGLTGVWLVGGIADKYDKPIVGKSSIYELSVGATQAYVDEIDFAQARKSYKDDRIKAAFLMAPAQGGSFSPKGLKSITAPTFIIVGDKDAIAPSAANAGYYAKNIKNSKFKMLKGNVSHLAFRNSVKPDKLNCATAFEFELNPEVNMQDVHNETAKLAIDFFDRVLKLDIPLKN